MACKLKSTALAAAMGLAIGASPVHAFPFWNFGGGGTSGAFGGDNQYTPYDGRYFLKEGGLNEMEFQVTSGAGTNFQEGSLVIRMELEGRAYNFPDVGTQGENLSQFVVDNSYIPLGDFTFTMNYEGAFFASDGDDFVLAVPNSFFGGSGEGTLVYDTDIVFDDADISVDGEAEGDVVYFATPNCALLASESNSSQDLNTFCAGSFFEWQGPLDGSASDGYSPIAGIFTSFDEVLGLLIPTDQVALFHAGLPCTPDGEDPPAGTTEAENAFFCNPGNSSLFPQFNGETGGISINPTYTSYTEFVAGHAAFINGSAAAVVSVPAPAGLALLGIGLAGISFARRRPKA